MNKRPSSILSVMLAMAGLGSTGPSARMILTDTSRPAPDPPEKPKSSARKRRSFNFIRERDGNQEQRLAKRAEKDLRAARMNYAGWCGRAESGELKAI